MLEDINHTISQAGKGGFELNLYHLARCKHQASPHHNDALELCATGTHIQCDKLSPFPSMMEGLFQHFHSFSLPFFFIFWLLVPS